MNSRIFLILSFIFILFLLVSNNACLLSTQRGCLIKMKNNDTVTLGLNETAVIKNIWKDISLKDWSIKIKVLALEDNRAQLQVISPTFMGKDFNETKFLTVGEYLLIIQSEEITTKIELEKVYMDNAALSLKIQSAPPAPELLESFDIEIK